jgi:hypothetical protein
MSLHIRVAYNKCDGLLRLPFRDFHLSLDGVPQRTFRRRILVPNPIRPSDICSSSMSGSQRGWVANVLHRPEPPNHTNGSVDGRGDLNWHERPPPSQVTRTLAHYADASAWVPLTACSRASIRPPTRPVPCSPRLVLPRMAAAGATRQRMLSFPPACSRRPARLVDEQRPAAPQRGRCVAAFAVQTWHYSRT